MTVMTFSEAAQKLPRMLLHGNITFDFDGMPLHAKKISYAQRLNLLLNGLNSLLGKSSNFGLPPIVQLELSTLCNLNCPLCPTGSDSISRPKINMSMEIFDQLLAEVGDSLIAVYLFCFGEPFLNKHLTRMVKACTAKNILTLTSTNGHFIQTMEEAIEVVESGLSALIIAVDGSTQKIYQKYRRGGNLEKVKQCISLIEEAKIKLNSPFPYTNMRTVVTRDNQDDLENLKKMAEDFGVNMFSYKSVGCMPSKGEFSNYEPTKKDLKRFECNDTQRKKEQPFQCIYPFRQPIVFSDGTVVGCEYDHLLEMAFGRIGEKPFAEIWNSLNSTRLRKSILGKKERPAFCQNCPYEGRVQRGSELLCYELRPLE
jgi:radical SAM protein with 4Fe4S-binding SPASM domain